jgi:hypothetical protein
MSCRLAMPVTYLARGISTDQRRSEIMRKIKPNYCESIRIVKTVEKEEERGSEDEEKEN